MLNANPNYSALYLYLKSLETENVSFGEAKYKSYDKENNNHIDFICFNIRNVLQTSDNIILKEMNYQGDLRFSFDKATNVVKVFKVPWVMQGETKVPAFTSDIAQIVLKQIKRYLNSPEIPLVFSDPLIPLAIDDKACTTIPSLKETDNYVSLKIILSRIRKEEEDIKKSVESYKRHQDKFFEAQERAVSQKRKIAGLDIKDYADPDDFYQDLSKLTMEKFHKKISNIKYHLEKNMASYKEMLRENGVFSVQYLYENELLSLWDDKFLSVDYTEYGLDDESILNIKDISLEKQKQILDKILENDLDEKGTIYSILKRIPEYLDEIRSNSRYFGDTPEREWYNEYKGTNQLFFEELEEEEIYNHPFFSGDGKENSKICDKAIQLLRQIIALREKLKHFEELLSNHSNFIKDFYLNSSVWGHVASLPYWVRSEVNEFFETYGLFMIAPGVDTISFDNLMWFRHIPRKKSSVFENNYTNKYDFDNLIIMIPKTIDPKSLRKIIDYYLPNLGNQSHSVKNINNSNFIIDKSLSEEIEGQGYYYNSKRKFCFVCEDSSIAAILKQFLKDYMITNVKYENKKFLETRLLASVAFLISVDPNYYNKFFANTPSNHTLLRQYDYSSNYRFRRKDFFSFDRQFRVAINLCIDENGNIDYRKLSILLLGCENIDEDSELYQLYLRYCEIIKREANYFLAKKFGVEEVVPDDEEVYSDKDSIRLRKKIEDFDSDELPF